MNSLEKSFQMAWHEAQDICPSLQDLRQDHLLSFSIHDIGGSNGPMRRLHNVHGQVHFPLDTHDILVRPCRHDVVLSRVTIRLINGHFAEDDVMPTRPHKDVVCVEGEVYLAVHVAAKHSRTKKRESYGKVTKCKNSFHFLKSSSIASLKL